MRTNDTEDLRFLDVLLARHPGVYRRSPGPSILAPAHWQESYSITSSDRIYVKIDDDIVFIQVLSMLVRKLLHVSGN